ncbi:MAG: cupin [Casimicrobiaceae bacterium]
MNEPEFSELLAVQGYAGPSVFTMAPNVADTEHSHGVDIFALVVEGSITIEKSTGNGTYGVGDIFDYPAGQPHAEISGPQGVKILYGKRQPAA